MTSKERVLNAVARRPVDRLPIQTYLTPEMEQRLMDHFGVAAPEQLLDILGVDLRGVNPPYVAPLPPLPPGSDLVDEWGVGYMMFDHGHGGAYPEPNHLALARITTMEDFEAYPWPSPDGFDYDQVPALCDAVADYAVCAGHAGMPDIVNGVGRGRGMEQVLLDIMSEDPVGVAIIDRRCDFHYEFAARTLDAAKGKVDILCIGEDTGNQRGPMFDPEVFDRFFRPRIQRYIDLAHDFGCKAMMHSCGSTRALQPRFIAMGLDILDAVQPEPAGMDPEEVKAAFGDRLTYCGMISTQKTLPFGSVEECRAEARHRLALFADGGYIFSPAHCIQANTPLENVLAVYEEALRLAPGALSRG
ncbi:MAG TPA: uroporphyrinogen decarboxylase family protein [Candidatus Hydrogenedentes bacterium]|nr:uroporphyrinogen decarboxylase family protein [Candidatus Hydrogenedentota bacterium]